MRTLVAILTVVGAILAVWYVAAIPMNMHEATLKAERAGVAVVPPTARERRALSGLQLARDNPSLWSQAYVQDRPRLPAPHQIVQEIWKTTGAMVLRGRAFSKRSLITHGWVTLSATLVGFAFGTVFGLVLAVAIVYNRPMDLSAMPWVIASQTVPITAIAPMVVVALGKLQVDDLIVKGVISMYLSFFPVVVGMVKGLRSPDAMQLDQMKTWNASGLQTFLRLRLPSAMPLFFASLKVGIAASLIGAVVAEMSLSQDGGLGARLLSGSYNGQMLSMWAALLVAAALAAALVFLIGAIQDRTLTRMGFNR
ncbi:MAG: ABC transporter permease subunit [Pseudomonadota bacterium]